MTSTQTKALFTRDFWFLSTAHFLEGLSYCSLLLFPLYLDYLGASRALIGTITGVAAFSGLLARPLIAWFLDSIGRKITIYVGTVAVAIAMLGLLWVQDLGPWVYIVQFVLGIGEGFLFAAYFTFASDIVPAHRRTEGLALFGISGLLPMLINPISDQLDIAAEDLPTFFFAIGFAVLASLLFIRPLKEDSPTSRRRQAPKAVTKTSWQEGLATVTRALSRPSLAPCWLATIIFATVVGAFFAFSTVAAEDRSIESPRTIWLAYTLGAASIRAFGGRIFDAWGPHNLIAPGAGAYVAALFLISDAQSYQELMVAGGLAGLGHGICFPVIASLVTSRSPEALRGTALTMFTALWEVATIGIRPAAGWVCDVYGDGAMFYGLGMGALVLLVGWAALEHGVGERSQHLPKSPVSAKAA